MGQCFLDYDGLKQFWKVVKDNFVRLNKEDGSITVNAVKIKDYTDSHVLLAGGGLKPLSEFGSGGGSGSGGTTSSTHYPLTIKINKTSKSFNGSAAVTVDITTNKLINDLGTATATPQDGDYFISQFVGGGTETTTYHRRPMSSLWAYIKNKTDAQYATSGHTHSNYLPLTGGTLTGDLTTSGVLKATTIKKSGSNSTNDFVLLAGGGTKPLSEFGSGSGSTPTINATLWGNSFNGSGSVNGDIVFFNLGQSVSNSRGIRLHNPGVVNDMAVEASGFIGFSKISDTGTGSFTGISLGWGASPEKSASSVRINNTTFTYKGNKILHTGIVNLPSTFGVKIQIDSETTAHVTEHFGDYVIASTTSNDHDAFIDVVDTILTENHYITSVYISITNNKLKTLLTNGFVKFGYSIKDDGIQQMRILQSNFDGTILYIEYIHTENTAAAYSTCFDCIWEVWK